jgi:hypothetical protein
VGLFSIEVAPSPKFHNHEAGDPVLLSVNVTVKGAFPEIGEAENAETGGIGGEVTTI